MLRWLCLIPCLALSAWYSVTVVLASIALAFFVYVYNELEFNAHWLGRSIFNGAGLACFEIGATLIAGHDRTTLDRTSQHAIIISTSTFITTIHTQDIKDVFGDEKVGRRTLPIIFPMASRVLVLILLVAWSLGLMYLWNTGPLISGILLALASFIGLRFIFSKSVHADQRSFY